MARMLAAFFGMMTFGLAAGQAVAQSRDALFDDSDAPTDVKLVKPAEPSVRYSGDVQFDYARVVSSPEHDAHLRLSSDLNAQGGGGGLKWKLGARVSADAAYMGQDDIYPPAVRKDQKLGLELRENYADFKLGGLDARAGKQNIVWGEMVGLFVADVVSPRDRRNFLQTELDEVRRSQWALRLEKFSGDWHSEFVWVPVQTYDEIGKPGADFYPYPVPATPGYAYVFNPEQRPRNDLGNSGVGLRTGVLRDGWDMAAFAYLSRDVAPTFERQVVNGPTPATIYTPVHDHIRQLGGTVSKDFDGIVWKGEMVWTGGRRYSLTRLDDEDGLLSAQSLDFAFGADLTPWDDVKFNFQLFGRQLSRHDDSMLVDQLETGGSAMLTYTWSRSLETQVLWVTSFNRSEGWFNPVLVWKLRPETRLRLGADVFYGPATGAFGRYDKQDRVWGELRQSF